MVSDIALFYVYSVYTTKNHTTWIWNLYIELLYIVYRYNAYLTLTTTISLVMYCLLFIYIFSSPYSACDQKPNILCKVRMYGKVKNKQLISLYNVTPILNCVLHEFVSNLFIDTEEFVNIFNQRRSFSRYRNILSVIWICRWLLFIEVLYKF